MIKEHALTMTFLLGMTAVAGGDDKTLASWPEFHGPNRDNISTEKGLLKKWPEGGPRLAWKFAECGTGHSGMSIADGMIFMVGDFDREERVFALSMEGKLLWQTPNGEGWRGSYPGSRTTPTYHQGVLYHMNPNGRLAAYKAKTGKSVWSVDLKAKFGARHGIWAFAENVVIEGDKVICVPGGKKGLVVALDKKTGKTIWTNTDLDEAAAFCSPIVETYKGVRQFITMTQRSVISVDVKTGKLLWAHRHETPYDQNITTPILHDGHVLVASGHKKGAVLLKINSDQTGVTEVWARKDLDNCHGGLLMIDGRVYGSACKVGGKKFFCTDFITGESMQADKTIHKLSLTTADDMLYGLSYKGRMLLMAITKDGYRNVSEFDVPRKSRFPFFCHPVICGGKMYLRHDTDLLVYDVSAK